MRVVDWDASDAAWDEVVRNDPEGTVEQLAAWRHVMRDGLDHACAYRAVVGADGRPEAVLPLVRVRSLLFGHYLMSMPFLNAGGPAGSAEGKAALVAAAVAEAERSGAGLLEFRTRATPPDGLEVSRRKITRCLPLAAEPEELFARFPAKLRSQIRRGTKDGLEGRTGDDQRGAFYDVFARQMRTLGTPVLPPRWFEAIATHLHDQVLFVAVYAGNTPVAGACGFTWQGRAEITWAGARREWSRSAPNMLLYWTFMREAIARGMHTFDLGRCTPGSPTHAFKKQWGGEDVPLHWGQWRRGAVTATPSPDQGIYRLATRCWQRLPLALTNRMGPFLARGLP